MFGAIEWMDFAEFDRKKAVMTGEGNCDDSDESEFLQDQWSFLQKLDRHFEKTMGSSGFDATGPSPVFLSDTLRSARFFYCEVDADQIGIIPDLGLAAFLRDNCRDYAIMVSGWRNSRHRMGSILLSPEKVMANNSLKVLGIGAI